MNRIGQDPNKPLWLVNIQAGDLHSIPFHTTKASHLRVLALHKIGQTQPPRQNNKDTAFGNAPRVLSIL